MADRQERDDASALKSVGGARRIVNAARYSLQGLSHAVRFEAAFRQELMLLVPSLVVAMLLPLPPVERLLLLACGIAVLVVELLNSAVEATVDRISLERHPLAGRAKDLGSAAVALTVVLFVLAWATLAGPTLLKVLRT